jgi:hypothetical protein
MTWINRRPAAGFRPFTRTESGKVDLLPQQILPALIGNGYGPVPVRQAQGEVP